MIKNLLYSLFLHFVLIAVVYTSFNHKYRNKEEISEIAISMSISPVKSLQPKKEIKKPVKKEPVKKTKSKNKPPKKKLKLPKKEDKKKIEKEKKEKEREKKEREKIEKEKREKEIAENAEKNKAEQIDNSIENLNLSAREKFNIQSQLRRCYKKAIKESGSKSKAEITIKASIDQNGYIQSNIDEIINDGTHSKKSFKIAVANAKRALEFCSPIRNLPRDKYYIWKEVTLKFDEQN